jgi:hypothetical protein
LLPVPCILKKGAMQMKNENAFILLIGVILLLIIGCGRKSPIDYNNKLEKKNDYLLELSKPSPEQKEAMNKVKKFYRELGNK